MQSARANMVYYNHLKRSGLMTMIIKLRYTTEKPSSDHAAQYDFVRARVTEKLQPCAI